jgi:hypothetical protein
LANASKSDVYKGMIWIAYAAPWFPIALAGLLMAFALRQKG